MSLSTLPAYRLAVAAADAFIAKQGLRRTDAPRSRLIGILATAYERNGVLAASDVEVICTEQLRKHAERIQGAAQ
jgi:hypothetical protein